MRVRFLQNKLYLLAVGRATLAGVVERCAVNKHAAGGRFEGTGENTEEGGFPGSVCPHNAKPGAHRNGDVETVQDGVDKNVGTLKAHTVTPSTLTATSTSPMRTNRRGRAGA